MQINKSLKYTNCLKTATKLAFSAGLVSLMSGCLLTSPFWAQKLTNRTDPVPLQAWTPDKTKNVVVQCAKAGHGGFYPNPSSPDWNSVTILVPSQNPSYDSTGTYPIHSAGKLKTLPSACWHYDNVFKLYVTAVRAYQGSTDYATFNKAGLECLGKWIGKTASWYGYSQKGCELTYSNSNNNINYVRVLAEN